MKCAVVSNAFTFVSAYSHCHRNNDAFFSVCIYLNHSYRMVCIVTQTACFEARALINIGGICLGMQCRHRGGIWLNQKHRSTISSCCAYAAAAVAVSHLKLIMITFYYCYRWHCDHWCVFPSARNWSFVLSIHEIPKKMPRSVPTQWTQHGVRIHMSDRKEHENSAKTRIQFHLEHVKRSGNLFERNAFENAKNIHVQLTRCVCVRSLAHTRWWQ